MDYSAQWQSWKPQAPEMHLERCSGQVKLENCKVTNYCYFVKLIFLKPDLIVFLNTTTFQKLVFIVF